MNGKLVSIFTVAVVLAAGSAAYAINNNSLAGHATSTVGVATADLSTNAIVSNEKHSARPIQQALQSAAPQATPASGTPANTSTPNPQATPASGTPTHSQAPAPQATQAEHSTGRAKATALPTPVPTASTPAGFPTPPPGFTPGQGGDDDGGDDDGNNNGPGGFHHDDDN